MKTLLAPALLHLPARLGTWATSARQGVLTDGKPAQPRARAGAAELRAIREADLHRALARLADTGTAVRVGRYSLVKPRQDPADRLAEAQAVIHRRHWVTSLTTVDNTEGATRRCARSWPGSSRRWTPEKSTASSRSPRSTSAPFTTSTPTPSPFCGPAADSSPWPAPRPASDPLRGKPTHEQHHCGPSSK